MCEAAALAPWWRGQVREALAVRRTIISGGGSLASHLDDFFEVLGLPVVNGWGLTETSPVLACRRVLQVRSHNATHFRSPCCGGRLSARPRADGMQQH